MQSEISRRAALLAATAGSTVVLAGCAASAQPAKSTSSGVGPAAATPAQAAQSSGHSRAVKPLPFDPAKLPGLSEKLIVSHHESNYGGAVRNLIRVAEELGRISKEAAPFVLGGLKQAELTYQNSVTLHELYFANLGGDGRRAGPMERALSDAHGSFSRWEDLFRGIGSSLGGGSGWVVTAWDFHRAEITTNWSGNHTQSLSSATPLLVMDMYEHAYQMDYGAAAAKYVDAFFANIHWEEVHRRLERAQKAAAVMRA